MTGTRKDATAPEMWRLTVTVPAAASERTETALADTFAETLLASSRFEAAVPSAPQVEILVSAEPAAARIQNLARFLEPDASDLTVERVPGDDWIAQSLGQQPPLRLGRFWIHGSHEAAAPPPSSTYALCIDAGLAFGTGRHESTKGCLAALERLRREMEVRSALDFGCGTGILALAAAQLWRCPVLAADIDSDAVEAARNNARRNRLAQLVRVTQARSPSRRNIEENAPYYLVTANILAKPLILMASALRARVRHDGRLVLSGFVVQEACGVVNAYRAQGFHLAHRIDVNGWRTLVLFRRTG